jgi:hypothetical protein
VALDGRANRRSQTAGAGVEIGEVHKAGHRANNRRSRRAGCDEHKSGSVRGAPGVGGAYSMKGVPQCLSGRPSTAACGLRSG